MPHKHIKHKHLTHLISPVALHQALYNAWVVFLLVGPVVICSLLFSNQPVRASIPAQELTVESEVVDSSNQSIRRWYPSGEEGGGFQSVIAISPHASNHGKILVGSDVGGIHRSDSFGSLLSTANNSFYANDQFKIASFEWSTNANIPNRVYALGGTYPGSGTLFVTDTAGQSWTRLNTTTSLASGGNNSAPLPVPHPRSTGKMIAVNDNGDTTQSNDIVYVASFSGGVYKSTNGGVTLSVVGLSGKYLRSLIIDPSNSQVLYAATYGDGVYRTTDSGSTWNKLSGTNNVTYAEELTVINNKLYVVGNTGDVSQSNVSNTGTVATLASPASAGLTTSWTIPAGNTTLQKNKALMSIDGYYDSGTGQDVYYVGCFQPGSSGDCLFKTTNSGASYSAPEATATISASVGHPGGHTWWHSVASASSMFGGGTYAAAQIRVDPNDHNIIYLSGRAGVWRTTTGGTSWYPMMQGLQGTINSIIDVSSNGVGQTFHGDTDWTGVLSDDTLWTVSQDAPYSSNTSVALDIDDSTTTTTLYNTTSQGDVWYKSNSPGTAFINANAWTNLLGGDGKKLSEVVTIENNAGRCGSTYSDPEQAEVIKAQVVSGESVVIVGVPNCGIYKKTGSGNWLHVASGTSSSNTAVPLYKSQGFALAHMDWPKGSSNVLLYDRKSGVWCSSDRGDTWTKVWATTVPDDSNGYVAFDRFDPKVVYVSTDTGLYRFDGTGGKDPIINNSGTCQTVTNAPTAFVSDNMGAMTTDIYGNLYAIKFETSSSTPHLYKFTNPLSSNTYTDISDAYFQEGVYDSTGIAVDRDGNVYVGSRGTGTWAYRNNVVHSGQTIKLRYKVSNKGSSTATGPFTFTVTIPAQLTYQSYSGTGWSCDTAALPTLVCTLTGSITSNGTANNLVVQTTVGSTFGNFLVGYNGSTGQATLSSVSGEDTDNNRTATTLTIQPGLSMIAKSYNITSTDPVTVNLASSNSLYPTTNGTHIILPETATLLSTPTSGSAVKNIDGTYTYTPYNTSFGTEVLNYQLCTSDYVCDTQTVTFTTISSPTISNVSPATGSIAGGSTVTITGSSFQSGATVSFGGTAATSVTFNSATSLTAVAPAGAAGVISITVTNPDTGNTTSANSFTFVDNPPTVSLTQPANGATLSGSSYLLKATATDDGSVNRVEFYYGATLIGTDTTPNVNGFYTYTWDTTAVPNGSFAITALAYDDASPANSTTSTVATVTISNATQSGPNTPTGLNATTASASQINLTWNANPGGDNLTSYNLYRNGTLITPKFNPATLSYSDTGLSPSTTYTYRLAAENVAGVSALSSAATATTDAAPDTDAPSTPSNLSTSYNSGTETVTLRWDASTDNIAVDHYAVLRDGHEIASVLPTSTCPSSSQLCFADTSVVQGQSYIYTVTATDAAGNTSAESAGTAITIPDTQAPTAPDNLAASYSNDQVSLSWDASTDNLGVASYTVLRGGVAILSGITGTSATDSSPSAGANYSYTVVALDAAGNISSASNAATVSIPSPPPPPPDPPAPTCKLADINCDGVVNIFDLSILLSIYNSSDHRGDFDNNGTVNIFDLSTLLSRYGS